MSTAPEPRTTPKTPLNQPLYGATFGQAFSRFWQNYATFTGRASRSEFWWWFLANIIVVTVLDVFILIVGAGTVAYDVTTGEIQLGPVIGFGFALLSLWGLATLIPTLAISWRRLHDTNRSGGFWFLGLIPGVGGIILLVLFLLDSDPRGARFDA